MMFFPSIPSINTFLVLLEGVDPPCQGTVNENKTKQSTPKICILKSYIKKNFAVSHIYKLFMKTE